MGIIYETTRKMHAKEVDFWNMEETFEYIQFYEFFELLILYSDDSEEMVANYLINKDEFLKLDFYVHNYAYVNNTGLDNVSPDDASYHNFLKTLDMKHEFYYHNYNAYENDDPELYPTEQFLTDALEEHIADDIDDKFWKVEDILKLGCIIDIGLDATIFDEHREAMNSDASTTLKYIRERKEFRERLIAEQVRNSKMQKIDPNIYDITVEQLAKKEEEIKGLLNKIEHLEQNAIADNDKTMHPRTANTVSKIIAALASELLNMDLTQPFANDSNGKIMAAIEKQGNTVSKDVIAHWLKLAHENSI